MGGGWWDVVGELEVGGGVGGGASDCWVRRKFNLASFGPKIHVRDSIIPIGKVDAQNIVIRHYIFMTNFCWHVLQNNILENASMKRFT